MRILTALLDKLRTGTATDEEIDSLDRRAFMFGMAATAGGLVVRPTMFLPSAPRVVFDYSAYAIRISGGGTMTVAELYEYCKREFCRNPGPPIAACDLDTMVRLEGSWAIDDETASHLYDGLIVQREGSEIYASHYGWGDL